MTSLALPISLDAARRLRGVPGRPGLHSPLPGLHNPRHSNPGLAQVPPAPPRTVPRLLMPAPTLSTVDPHGQRAAHAGSELAKVIVANQDLGPGPVPGTAPAAVPGVAPIARMRQHSYAVLTSGHALHSDVFAPSPLKAIPVTVKSRRAGCVGSPFEAFQE